MHLSQIITFSLYFAFLLILGLFVSKKQKSELEYVMGGRSLNFWLTALSAHASDMSSWLFLAYPAVVFTTGMPAVWAAIGLCSCMFLNWQYVAPRIRKKTEETNSLTLSSYFENRYKDTSGSIRIVSAISSLLFYAIYIAAGIYGLGIIVEELFSISYHIGITIGLGIVMVYVFSGGYKTVAWIDLFQGFFLLGVILIVPYLLIRQIGGIGALQSGLEASPLSMRLIEGSDLSSYWGAITLMLGWGLGYFGQPHIITKFMGIQKVSDMKKSQYVGISWQFLALLGATLLGLLGIYFFPMGLTNYQAVTIELVKMNMQPFFFALVLCAILAATTNVIAAQILVVASSLSEDFYKKLSKKAPSSKELLRVSRISVVLISLIGYFIAFGKISTIYDLVLYAWSGLGGTFAPLLLASLYSKKVNRYGAFWGVVVGLIFGALWPSIATKYGIDIPAMFMAFLFSFFTIFLVSFMCKKKVTHSEYR